MQTIQNIPEKLILRMDANQPLANAIGNFQKRLSSLRRSPCPQNRPCPIKNRKSNDSKNKNRLQTL